MNETLSEIFPKITEIIKNKIKRELKYGQSFIRGAYFKTRK